MIADPDRKTTRRRHRLIAAGLVVVLAIATGAAVLWSKRTKAALERDTRYIPKVITVTPEIELLRAYVRIDTSTPTGAAKGARWLAETLAGYGIQAELIESAPGRLNVYARVQGRERRNGLLLFNHIDVVPADGEWKHPPFEGRIVGDEMYGRGTIDMKSIAIAQLLAFVDIARNPQPPSHDLVFLATADEETGSEFGMRWIVANRPDVLADIAYGITEGGITEMNGEEMVYFGIEIGGKQMVDVDVVASSAETLRELRVALEPFIFPREPERFLPEVEAYFRAIAPTRVAFSRQLEDIRRTVREGTFWDLPAPYRDLTQNSLFVKAPERDGDMWRMNVRLLNLPDENPDERLAWLRQVVEAAGAQIGTVNEKEGPVPLSPVDTPFFELLAAEAERRYGVPAGTLVLYRSRSDSRFLRPLGINCYGVAPFPVTFFQANSIHEQNERIDLEAFQQGIGYMDVVTGKWAYGT